MAKYSIKVNPEDAVILIAQLDKEYRVFEENCLLNEKAWSRIQGGAKEELDWAALGYTLHTVYTTMENYFLRISKTFENHLPPRAWHRQLIDAMQLELPGIRPAFMSGELAAIADDLRGFRHVFRSMYEINLDPDRMSLIQKKIPRMQKLFKEAHVSYCQAITDLTV